MQNILCLILVTKKRRIIKFCYKYKNKFFFIFFLLQFQYKDEKLVSATRFFKFTFFKAF